MRKWKKKEEKAKKKVPPVRIELTTFRLWDWRAAYCAKEADMAWSRSCVIESQANHNPLCPPKGRCIWSLEFEKKIYILQGVPNSEHPYEGSPWEVDWEKPRESRVKYRISQSKVKDVFRVIPIKGWKKRRARRTGRNRDRKWVKLLDRVR